MKCYSWPPPRLKKKLAIAVAASTIKVDQTDVLAAIKASMIARAAALFKVEKIYIYKDKYSTWNDYKKLTILLKYLSTPPYLRKKIFPLTKQLKIAGLTLPVQIPVHDVPRKPEKGLILYGLVEKCRNRSGCQILLGNYGTGILKDQVKEGSIILVRIKSLKPIIVERVNEPDFYVGFSVRPIRNINYLITKYRNGNAVIIGTSKYGTCAKQSEISKLIKDKDEILIIVGGPRGTITEDIKEKLLDIIINTVPYQGTRTIRTEEALYINLLFIYRAILSTETL